MNELFKVLYTPEDIVEVRLIANRGERHPPQSFFCPGGDLPANIQTLNRTYNVYFGVNPRKGESRKEIARIPACFADVDRKNHTNGHFQNTLDRLKKLGLYPTVRVDSGHGEHWYWLLDCSPDPEAWRATQKMLQTFCGGDAVHDLPRILRVPGTKNIKDRNNPVPCEIIETTGIQYNLFDFFAIEEDRPTSLERNGKNLDRITLEVLSQTSGVCDSYADFIRLGLAFRAGGFSYDEVAPVFAKSANYNEQENRRIYAGLKPAQITMKTAYHYAEKHNPKALKERIGKCSTPDTATKTEKPPKKKKTKINAWAEMSEAGTIKINPGRCSEAFFEQQAGNLIFVMGAFYRWNGKIWVMVEDAATPKARVRQYIAKAVGSGPITKSKIEDIIFQVSLQALKNVTFNSQKNLISLQNGMLDVRSGELMPHDREAYQTIILPFSYDETADCPRFKLALCEMGLDDDSQMRLQEWFGYCLIPDTSIEKCLMLLGEGANGKSVILEVLMAMLFGNVCSLEPESMFERFQLLALRDKLVNVCTDISTKKALSEQFKKVVSGETFTVDVKNRDHITFRPFARHIFSANRMPSSSDKSEGFFRRFDVLMFERRFSESERDEGLKEYLKKHELPGVFNWSLTGLRRLLKNGLKMTSSSQFQRSIETFRRESNPLLMFVEENFRLITEDDLADFPVEEWGEQIPRLSVSTARFRELYVAWCQRNGHKPLSQVHLGRQVLALPHIQEARVQKVRIKVDSHRFHVYSGLKELCVFEEDQ